MSRKDRPSQRRRGATKPSRGRKRSRGDGGFHHWKLHGHDVHISDAIPFDMHQGVLEQMVAPHLKTGGAIVTDKGFQQTGYVTQLGNIIVSTDRKHNETWVFFA